MIDAAVPMETLILIIVFIYPFRGVSGLNKKTVKAFDMFFCPIVVKVIVYFNVLGQHMSYRHHSHNFSFAKIGVQCTVEL